MSDETSKRCNKHWDDYFHGKRIDPPDLREFAQCAEVNKKWIQRLSGMTKGGKLHRMLRAVQRFFYKRSSFKVSSMTTRGAARQALLDFANDAPNILANQDTLKLQNGVGGGAISSSSAASSSSSSSGGSAGAPKLKRARLSTAGIQLASPDLSAAVADAEAAYLKKKTENEKEESHRRQVKTQVDILKGMGHSFSPEQLKEASAQLDLLLNLAAK